MWKARRLTSLWTFKTCYRVSFFTYECFKLIEEPGGCPTYIKITTTSKWSLVNLFPLAPLLGTVPVTFQGQRRRCVPASAPSYRSDPRIVRSYGIKCQFSRHSKRTEFIPFRPRLNKKAYAHLSPISETSPAADRASVYTNDDMH
jgi:hypothetical protein